MKYIIIPLFNCLLDYVVMPSIKFGWAAILCALATIYYLVVCTALLLWNFKLKAEWVEVNFKPSNNISPYWKPFVKERSYYFSRATFKSLFHYIFGIEDYYI